MRIFVLLISFALLPAFSQEHNPAKAEQAISELNQILRDSLPRRQELRRLLTKRASLLRDLMEIDPERVLDLVLPETTRSNLSAMVPDSADAIEVASEWNEPVTVVVEDDFKNGVSRTHFSVSPLGETIDVFLAGESGQLKCGDRVRMRGLKLKNAIAARLIGVQASAAGCFTVGDQKTAVILLNFPSSQLPSQVTPSYVQNMFFGTGGNSVAGFWNEASYGLTTSSGSVFGPFTLAQDFSCGQTDQIRDAAIAAADGTIDFRNYTRIHLILPAACGGLGSIGCSSLSSPSKGAFQASVSWIGIDAISTNDSGVCTAAHESGHNLGLNHGSSLAFGNSPLGSLGNPGTHTEYGDPFSLMGSCFTFNGTTLLGHYAAPHKNQLGWLGTGNLQTVQAPGTFALLPYETPTSALQTLRIERGVGSNLWLWVEYRRPVGYDSTFQAYTSQPYSGVLVHYEDPSLYLGYTHLLDFTAAITPGVFTDAALAGGQSWSDPYTPLSLQITNVTPSSASVTVSYDTPCATLNIPSRAFGSGAGSDTVTVTAPGGCSWTAASNAGWITITGGASGTGNGIVSYSVLSNTGANPRSSSISIGRQIFLITQSSPNNPPTPVSISPSSGTTVGAATQQFQAIFSDGDGATTLTAVRLLVNASSALQNGCFLLYDRPTNQLRIYDNAGSGWTYTTPGSNTTASNSQCTLYFGASSVQVSGNSLTLTVSLSFTALFAGSKTLFMSAQDSAGGDSGWQQLGTRTISTGVNSVPSPVAVAPGSGSSLNQTFTFQFSDPDGYADLDVLNVLINSALDGNNSCYLAYSRPINVLYLVNNAGNGLLPGLVLNGSGSTSNSQCTINGAGSSASGAGNTLTLTLSITFGSGYAGNKIVYTAARDSVQNNSGWQSLGVWKVPGGSASNPSIISVAPARVTTSTQSVAFTFNDTAGFTDLGVLNILINNFLNGNSACYLAYSRPLNVLYLVNDAGTALLPGLVLNGTGSVSNSQCTITGAGSSSSGNGSTLTLTLNMTLSGGFHGNKVLYTAARTAAEANSGWQSWATWTAP